MRTKLFGRLLPLALLCTAPQTGCSDLFASYLRFDDPGDGGIDSDGGTTPDPADLLGADLAGVDQAGGPPPCTWTLPVSQGTLPSTNITWFRIAVGDFNNDTRPDIAAVGMDSGTSQIKTVFLFQNATCGFTAQMPIASYSAAPFNLPNTSFDFGAFKRASAPGWNTVAIGPTSQIQWCSSNGNSMDCINAVMTLPGMRTGEKKLVVDTRGRTESDHIVVHTKGTPDSVTRFDLSGGSIMRSASSFDLSGEPGFVVSRRHGSSTMALGVASIMTGTTTRIGVRTFNGTAYTEPAMPSPYDYGTLKVNSALIGYELYLYAGRFGRLSLDDLDDLVAIQKTLDAAQLTVRTFNVNSQRVEVPVSWGTITVGPTFRDHVLIRDIDGDNLDEVVVVRRLETPTATNQTAEFEVFGAQDSGAFTSRGVQKLELGTTAVSVDTLTPPGANSRPAVVSIKKDGSVLIRGLTVP